MFCVCMCVCVCVFSDSFWDSLYYNPGCPIILYKAKYDLERLIFLLGLEACIVMSDLCHAGGQTKEFLRVYCLRPLITVL